MLAWSIPACAGEPVCLTNKAGQGWVYPRVRGGTNAKSQRAVGDTGLSPRARGNPEGIVGSVPRCRSIPACAGEPRRLRRRNSQLRVYPRVRGGTLINSPMPAQGGGLSPRARGNRCRAQSGRLPARSIPACAGERSAGAGAERLTRVYPRVRGGTKPFNVQPADGTGLSPRARGNHRSRRQQDVALGSIPACAGEPAAPAPAVRRLAVYPRVRGGTRERVQMSLEQRGLSPRARGNLMRSCLRREMLGSIPACAGEPPP